MFAYRLLLTFLAPVVAIWLALRLVRGRERWSDLRERLGRIDRAPDGPRLWLHGASNGELTSARGLIEALLAHRPDVQITVTANSLTGRDMVRGWSLPRLSAYLAPLDYRVCLSRFLACQRPMGLVLIEGDLWPNRFVLPARRGLPVAMVSARISERSFRIWRRLGGPAHAMMQATRFLSAQDEASEERFLALGLPRTALQPRRTLKSAVLLPPPEPDALAPFRAIYDREETLLAASTHAGEEAQVISAFTAARATRPGLKMILAPRHAKRSAEVAALLGASGLAFATRSAGEMPGPDTEVYLADTLGEMPLWYALAGFCFVGGSLVDKGGHTPFEPAQFDCAILHGPYLSNFAEPFAALAEAGGAVQAEDAESLGAAIAGLDAPRRAVMAQAAREALALDDTAAFAPLLDGLDALFDSAERR